MREYLIPSGHGEAELAEKRSRFLGRVWQVTSEDEAQALIKSMREQHADANHNVYAYIIRETGVVRYSDDGEPSGTAGMPVLNVLTREEITNVLCVVTRYFGGTLLGAGGLVRAYGQAAKLALDAAGISAVRQWREILLGCTYAQYERLSKLATDQGAVVEATDFGADVTLTLLVPEPEAEAFFAYMTEASAGTAILESVGQKELPVRIR